LTVCWFNLTRHDVQSVCGVFVPLFVEHESGNLITPQTTYYT